MIDKFITVAQLAERIGKSERWVHLQLKNEKKIEHVKSAQKLNGSRTGQWMIQVKKSFFENN